LSPFAAAIFGFDQLTESHFSGKMLLYTHLRHRPFVILLYSGSAGIAITKSGRADINIGTKTHQTRNNSRQERNINGTGEL
jgi:hypothetical protein